MTTPADGLRWDATPRRCREFAIRKLLTGKDLPRREQIEDKLRSEPREEVGRFAVFCVQTSVLSLKPWVSPPVSWRDDGRNDCPGEPEMRALVARMKQLRVCLAHPDPVRAIEQAEAARGAAA